MRVLHIFNELKFSGAEIMYADAAPLFQAKGCELTAMATSPNIGVYAPYLNNAGYQILHKPYPALKNIWARYRYYKSIILLLKKEKYDVVHIHLYNAMWGMSLCAWLAGKRAVYTFHNVFLPGKFTYTYHYLLRWSAKYIFKCRFQTISNSVYNHELKLYRNKTTKIYNWYNSTRFYPASKAEKMKVREELNISADTLVLISIGGCSPVKCHSDIIKALPMVLQENKSCLYLHLGTGTSENEEKVLAERLGIINNIMFCGNQTDVRKYLIAANLYLMTSKFEGISNTTIEALACCIPAILYDVPGLRDFNATGQNSILIPEDYALLSEKILYLKKNEQVASKISASAKAFVDSAFSIKKNVDQIYHLYL